MWNAYKDISSSQFIMEEIAFGIKPNSIRKVINTKTIIIIIDHHKCNYDYILYVVHTHDKNI